MYNKAEAKLGPKALWWFERANQRSCLVRPPCYMFRPRKSWRDKTKIMVRHLILCRRYPWSILPHKAGWKVEDSVLEPYFGEEATLKAYEETFGHPYNQPASLA